MKETVQDFGIFSQWHEQASAGLLTLHGLGLVGAASACRCCCHHSMHWVSLESQEKGAWPRCVFSDELLPSFFNSSHACIGDRGHEQCLFCVVPIPSDLFGRGHRSADGGELKMSGREEVELLPHASGSALNCKIQKVRGCEDSCKLFTKFSELHGLTIPLTWIVTCQHACVFFFFSFSNSLHRVCVRNFRIWFNMLEIFQLRYFMIFTIKKAFKPSKRD